MRIVAPSILSADFGNLERDIKMIDRSEAKWVHIDVMDGVFVPNISFGFPVVKSVRKSTNKLLDVHLMIVEPEKYVKRFVEAGANYVTFHHEACANPRATIAEIRSVGAKAGVSIKPATPVEAIFDYLGEVDMVLVMTVEPGFGGQSLIPETLEKVKIIRKAIDENGYNCNIQVDGGISEKNISLVTEAGANVIVAGTAVFRSPDPKKTIEDMRKNS